MHNADPQGPAPSTDCSELDRRRNTASAQARATHRKTDRRQAPRPSALPQPLEIAKFWKNRRGEAVVVRLGEFHGHVFLDLRVNFTNSEGRLQPTTKGVAVPVRRLLELTAALAKAEAKARELGLLQEASE